MSTGRRGFVAALLGMACFVGAGLYLVTTSDSPQGSSSPLSKESGSPPPDGKPVDRQSRELARRLAAPKADARATQAPPATDRPAATDGSGGGESILTGGSPKALLKSYEALWIDPDVDQLRAAEGQLLGELERLPPARLVALLAQGLSTRSANLVLITLENAMRGPRRSDYEDALVQEMRAVAEQPDKLGILSVVALRFDLSPENAEVVEQLLTKQGPAA